MQASLKEQFKEFQDFKSIIFQPKTVSDLEQVVHCFSAM